MVKSLEGFDVNHVAYLNAVGVKNDSTRDSGITQLLNHEIGLAKVFVATITTSRNKA